MSLGCEMLKAKKRSLKVMCKMGECGAGVTEGNVVLVKVTDVEQMWQEASVVEQAKANHKQTGGGSRDGLPKVNMEMLPLCGGMNI